MMLMMTLRLPEGRRRRGCRKALASRFCQAPASLSRPPPPHAFQPPPPLSIPLSAAPQLCPSFAAWLAPHARLARLRPLRRRAHPPPYFACCPAFR
eukprot:5006143-Pleurochrysis_carterae.AAC.1